MRNEDNSDYLRFTGPQRLDKAMHTLEGIVNGISIDGRVSANELGALTRWMGEHAEFSNRHPFNEVLARLHEILADGVIDEEECADLLWLCNRFSTENQFYEQVAADMQRLQGILSGIVADGIITESELRGLRTWMEAHGHLRTCWPYDELDAVITTVLADGKIDAMEQAALLRFFGEFSARNDHRTLELMDGFDAKLIQGVCASCPEIEFPARTFCFTGASRRSSRRALAQQIESLGGIFSPRVTQQVNYLIVGADGNPCWAFACYGRKVEQAVKLRKQGIPLLIVHEHDYWDAVQELT